MTRASSHQVLLVSYICFILKLNIRATLISFWRKLNLSILILNLWEYSIKTSVRNCPTPLSWSNKLTITQSWLIVEPLRLSSDISFCCTTMTRSREVLCNVFNNISTCLSICLNRIDTLYSCLNDAELFSVSTLNIQFLWCKIF